jgi:ADP-heptose:LPS heptosyltransferase
MPFKKLLTIHQGALGDVITSFTALLLLKQTYNQIHLLCPQAIARVSKYLGVVDSGFGLESAAFSYLFSEKPDNTNTAFKNFLRSHDDIVLFSYSKILSENLEKITDKRVFQIPPRPLPSAPVHVAQSLISQLVNLKILKKGDEKNFLRVHRDFRINFRKQRVFIHPGSGSSIKNWPLAYFGELKKLLSEDGFEPVFLLGPAEKDISEILQRKSDCLQRHTLHLSDLVDLVNTLKTGGGFIGNDSGVSHLAAFLGLPALVIFGPTDTARWSPLGCRVETICSPTFCPPCFETAQKGCDSMKCLTEISPRQVQNKFNMLTR